jgi:hypothetical protein
MSVSVVEQAISQRDVEIASAQANVDRLRVERLNQWEAFVHLARTYLVATFRARFLELRHTIVDPILALSGVTRADGKPLMSVTSPHLEPDNQVAIRWYEDSASGARSETLFPHDRYSPLDCPSAIARFRASLPS